jgi:asparagine N-glycosylation enzyme membrane subunit Stt3
MAWYLIFFSMLTILVVVERLIRRNEKVLDPAIRFEYQKAKFISTKFWLPAIVIGLMLIGLGGSVGGENLTIAMLFPMFLFVTFILFRLIRERKIKDIGLPREFIRRDRFYGIMAGLTIITYVTVFGYI